jgi:hypothetical protein
LLAFAGGDIARAQGSTCANLEAVLSTLESAAVGGNAAASSQKRYELDRAVAQARSAGCIGGMFSFFSPRSPSPNCPSLVGRIQRLQSELVALSRLGNGGNAQWVAAERNRMLRALANNGCGPQYAASTRATTATQSPPPQGSSYRTLCVRTCDGYYFPISFSTSRSNFQSDLQTCQQMCPAAEVDLYVQNPRQFIEQSVSLSGQPYTSLPTAFRYRTAVDPSCACRTGGETAFSTAYYPSLEAALGTLRSNQDRLEAATRVIVPIPRPRPITSEDPETLANRDGGLVPEPVSDGGTTGTFPVDAPPQTVRVVGPSYFYTLAQ